MRISGRNGRFIYHSSDEVRSGQVEAQGADWLGYVSTL